MFQSQKEIDSKKKSNLISAKKLLFSYTLSGLKEQIECGFNDAIFISRMFDHNSAIEFIPLIEEGWCNEDERSGKKVSLYKFNNIYGTYFIVGCEIILCEWEYEKNRCEKAMLDEFRSHFNNLCYFSSLEEAESYIFEISKLRIEDYSEYKKKDTFILDLVNFPPL